MAQCRAKSKRSGERCRRHAMKGKPVCHMHGGKTPTGIDSVNFKTGRYSRYIPERLLERYEEALNDEEITRLDSEIALIDTKLQDLLNRLEVDGEGPHAWQEVTTAHQILRAALTQAEPDAVAIRSAVFRMDRAIEHGGDEARAWSTIIVLIEQRRKLVDTERRRLADEDQAVSIDKLMLMMAAVVDIVRRHVASREARGAIAGEIRRLIAGPSSPS